MQLERIHEYWSRSAASERDQDDLRATARDPFLQKAVEMVLERRLPRGTRVLDVGCGDGQSSLRFAQSAAHVVGVDFVPDYVAAAARNASRPGVHNVTFQSGNVLDLAEIRRTHGMFDVVLTIRCLINLPDWDLQKRGIAELAACVAPGGLYLTSEGWAEGFAELNRFRLAAGLPAMNVVEFNRLMPRSVFEEEVSQYFTIEAFDSLGLYLYLSRVVQPVLVRPDAPSHVHPLNRAAAELLSAGAANIAALDRKGVV